MSDINTFKKKFMQLIEQNDVHRFNNTLKTLLLSYDNSTFQEAIQHCFNFVKADYKTNNKMFIFYLIDQIVKYSKNQEHIEYLQKEISQPFLIIFRECYLQNDQENMNTLKTLRKVWTIKFSPQSILFMKKLVYSQIKIDLDDISKEQKKNIDNYIQQFNQQEKIQKKTKIDNQQQMFIQQQPKIIPQQKIHPQLNQLNQQQIINQQQLVGQLGQQLQQQYHQQNQQNQQQFQYQQYQQILQQQMQYFNPQQMNLQQFNPQQNQKSEMIPDLKFYQPQQILKQKIQIQKQNYYDQNQYQEFNQDKLLGNQLLFQKNDKKIFKERGESYEIMAKHLSFFKEQEGSLFQILTKSFQLNTQNSFKHKIDLNQFNEIVLKSLYSDLKYKCAVCATFWCELEQLQQHYDWHFQVNSKKYEQLKKGSIQVNQINRKQFPNLDDWLKCDGKQNKNVENQEIENDQDKFQVQCKDKTIKQCAICLQDLQISFNQEKDQWIYEKCIQVEVQDINQNLLMHFNCFKIAETQID